MHSHIESAGRLWVDVRWRTRLAALGIAGLCGWWAGHVAGRGGIELLVRVLFVLALGGGLASLVRRQADEPAWYLALAGSVVLGFGTHMSGLMSLAHSTIGPQCPGDVYDSLRAAREMAAWAAMGIGVIGVLRQRPIWPSVALLACSAATLVFARSHVL